jgi:uncharacterized protein (DUF2345 family)
VLLTAQGACLKLEGGDIMLHAPGKVGFKASMKELGGPVNVPTVEIASRVGELNIKRDLEIQYKDADGNVLTDEPIELRFTDHPVKTIILDSDGKAVIKNVPLGPLRARQPKRR